MNEHWYFPGSTLELPGIVLCIWVILVLIHGYSDLHPEWFDEHPRVILMTMLVDSVHAVWFWYACQDILMHVSGNSDIHPGWFWHAFRDILMHISGESYGHAMGFWCEARLILMPRLGDSDVHSRLFSCTCQGISVCFQGDCVTHKGWPWCASGAILIHIWSDSDAQIHIRGASGGQLGCVINVVSSWFCKCRMSRNLLVFWQP